MGIMLCVVVFLSLYYGLDLSLHALPHVFFIHLDVLHWVWAYYFAWLHWLLCDKLKQLHENLTMFGVTTLPGYFSTN